MCYTAFFRLISNTSLFMSLWWNIIQESSLFLWICLGFRSSLMIMKKSFLLLLLLDDVNMNWLNIWIKIFIYVVFVFFISRVFTLPERLQYIHIYLSHLIWDTYFTGILSGVLTKSKHTYLTDDLIQTLIYPPIMGVPLLITFSNMQPILSYIYV